ncbi:MAG: hypothetical protein HC822_13140 [Oscillochloris sp.]|nr:hypothetical protein [Oscillochloris sp.]
MIAVTDNCTLSSAKRTLFTFMLALLLLGQPLLCLVHCEFVGGHSRSLFAFGDGRAFYLCDHPLPSAGHGLFIPAFWPTLVLPMLLFSVGLTLLGFLASPLRSMVQSFPLPPSLPPPRN